MLTRAGVERTICELTAAITFQRRSRICAALTLPDMQHVLSVAERGRDLIAAEAIREALARRTRAATARTPADDDTVRPWWEL
jgi:hypothetical protein